MISNLNWINICAGATYDLTPAASNQFDARPSTPLWTKLRYFKSMLEGNPFCVRYSGIKVMIVTQLGF